MNLFNSLLLGLFTLTMLVLSGCQTADKTQAETHSSANPSFEQQVEEDLADYSSQIVEDQVEDDETSQVDASSGQANSANLKADYFSKLEATKIEADQMAESKAASTTTELKNTEAKQYAVWDKLLNDIYAVLEEELPAEDMEALRVKQREWITFRDTSAEESSSTIDGGTMEELEYLSMQNKLTMVRCFELVAQYMPN